MMIKCLTSAPHHSFKQVFESMNIYGGIDKHGYPTTDQINFTERQVYQPWRREGGIAPQHLNETDQKKARLMQTLMMKTALVMRTKIISQMMKVYWMPREYFRNSWIVYGILYRLTPYTFENHYLILPQCFLEMY